MKETFRKISQKISEWVGSPGAFILAISLLVIWGFSGPIFDFSDTWQLVINTTTTIVTFLMVFLIQNTQNRENKALHLKLDELIRSNKDARNLMVNLENLSDEELAKLQEQFEKLDSHTEKISDKAEQAADVIEEKRAKRK